MQFVNKGNNKITELRAILQRESRNEMIPCHGGSNYTVKAVIMLVLKHVTMVYTNVLFKAIGCFIFVNKGNNKITELRAILQRESRNL
jgi:hypothetical protein